jgi:hypothetical protein
MILPPSIVRIKIVEKGKKKLGLFLPIFILLWPLIICAFVFFLPFLIVLFCLSLFIDYFRKPINVFIGILGLICSLKGLRVEVDDDNEYFFISLN